MGQYVNVNLDRITIAIGKIDLFRTERKSLLSQISDELRGMNAAWRADDYVVFFAEWNKLLAADGTLTQVDQALEGYHDRLSQALATYKNAQEEIAQQAEQIASWTWD
ncbi:MAG: hypothetical protein K5705_01400 [Oscillospiraceae bacterium]|nr:hypothetical protein [Oscillospiraceae bacterium]MCR4758923.1 hypothetical protein [Oscillospiraceae bacterium]